MSPKLVHADQLSRGELILLGTDAVIGLAFIWVGIEIVRFVWNSELVKKIKFNPEVGTSDTSLYKKVMLNTYLFASCFLLCGITHWMKVLQMYMLSVIIPYSIVVHILCMITGLITAITLSTIVRILLKATNALEITPEGRLGSAEACLLDIIDNCKESVAVLSITSLQFLRGNKSTALYFGDNYMHTSILDFVVEDDRHVFRECVSHLLGKKPRNNSLGKSMDADLEPHDFSDEESALLLPTADTNNHSVTIIEYRLINDCNELIWLESTDTPTTLMLLTRDITDKKAEIDIVKRENAAKLQYITCCAHDLKTPLQSFSSALDLMQSSGLNPDQMDIMNHAEISLSLMSLTISQAMDTSKALMGYVLSPKKTSCPLSDVLI